MITKRARTRLRRRRARAATAQSSAPAGLHGPRKHQRNSDAQDRVHRFLFRAAIARLASRRLRRPESVLRRSSSAMMSVCRGWKPRLETLVNAFVHENAAQEIARIRLTGTVLEHRGEKVPVSASPLDCIGSRTAVFGSCRAHVRCSTTRCDSSARLGSVFPFSVATRRAASFSFRR